MEKENYSELIKSAIEAKEFSYSPYSHFRVGAAILSDNGKIYSGCNIENASYGASNCAERTAIFKGVSEGIDRIIAIAISSDEEDFIYPCGICRQVIREFGSNIDIVLVNANGKTKQSSIKELLPCSFSKENLI
ncbi:cytidine deaminase [Alkalibaculum sp. M08DMB]|uniref:Cytidine deaminase n=1 Tax=Alkalibaculum sporogenes TaxID=2655001 RepID=A0A6A7KCB6_9FIRM|nr:cytidine deaminase [Alkalibaculum sporogenes]MPW27036.1 cytidine deaminase [Alkalibaculum sporogenes]